MTMMRIGVPDGGCVALRASRGRQLSGRIVHFDDAHITVTVPAGASSILQVGEPVELSSDSSRDGEAMRRGRVLSTYKVLAADHVVIEPSSSQSAEPLDEKTPTPDARRRTVRVRPEPSKPIVALLLIGKAVFEGRVRNVSADGIAFYVAGTAGLAARLGVFGQLVFCLPGQTKDCRFSARIIRREMMRHGIVFGLHVNEPETPEFLRQRRDLLEFVARRNDDVHPSRSGRT